MPPPAFRALISCHLHPVCFHHKSLSHLLCTNPHFTLSRNPLRILKSLEPSLFWSTINRSLSYVSQIAHPSIYERYKNYGNNGKTKRTPLTLFFKQTMGLSEQNEDCDDEIEESECKSEIGGLKRKLKELEMEVRRSKSISNSRVRSPNKLVTREPMGSLYAFCKEHGVCDDKIPNKSPNEGVDRLCSLFANPKSFDEQKVKEITKLAEEKKELSDDMIVFAKHLLKKGYMDNPCFLPNKGFDARSFGNGYGRKFLKDAAEKFGKNNQEIAKWLSGSALKKVALFGCPSIDQNIVLSTKKLRAFFRIKEDTVCKRCALRQTCEFRDKKAANLGVDNLDLVDVVNVIMLYDLKLAPSKLVVSNDVKDSVSLLLKEFVGLNDAMS